MQMVLAFARPEPRSAFRKVWNLGHIYAGRLCVLAAWADIYIGIVLYHDTKKASLVAWTVPLAVAMGLLLLLDAMLTWQRERAMRMMDDHYSQYPVGAMAAAAPPAVGAVGVDGVRRSGVGSNPVPHVNVGPPVAAKLG